MAERQTTTNNATIRPFEWLTSAESLHGKLQEVLEGKCKARVMHVGCGSSVLGEYIVEQFHGVIEHVVNVDNDRQTLESMEKRWSERCQINELEENKMKFLTANINQEESIAIEDGCVDVVVDKSTLDCLLCSDAGASSLIAEIHRLLEPQNGVYVLISFHHIDFLLPMLEECPGTDWSFSHTVMYRHVETLGTGKHPTTTTDLSRVELPEMEHSSSVWTSKGCFQPDEIYHRTVNVLIGRKQGRKTTTKLDRYTVYEHVNKCSDRWYQQQNPILTTERTNQIRQDLACPLPLEKCYEVLFTEEEREHLTYEAFMEDWATFLWTNIQT